MPPIRTSDSLLKTVRRLAISALNSAARHKPRLIRDHLGVLLPNLYKETVVRPELIRTVQMGPWTAKFDDGLEVRKAAYETMYTLVRCSDHLGLVGRLVKFLTLSLPARHMPVQA